MFGRATGGNKERTKHLSEAGQYRYIEKETYH
jgi:hypothetical protein